MIFLPLHSKSPMEGSIGIFQVLHWKTLVNYSFTVHCCLQFYGFSALVFSIWQKSFKWFFRFGVWSGFLFLFLCAERNITISADTVMIHVLIFSMKTDVILYSTCSTHHQYFRSIRFLKTFDGFVFSFDQNLFRGSVLGDFLAVFLF